MKPRISEVYDEMYENEIIIRRDPVSQDWTHS